MAEVLDVLDAFTMPLKIAWVAWLAWGVGQTFWYRYELKPRVASSQAATPIRKPFASKPSMPERASTRLITPDQVTPDKTPRQPSPVETPVGPPPIESAPALTEGPGEIEELDRFVADFEMHTRQRRGEPLNGEHSPFGSQLGE
jgi:hypothetical protein